MDVIQIKQMAILNN